MLDLRRMKLVCSGMATVSFGRFRMSSFFRSRHFVFGVIACVDVCFLLAEKERCHRREGKVSATVLIIVNDND